MIRFSDYVDDDSEGTWLPHASAARDYALRLIDELKEDEGYQDPNITLVVKDAAGQEPFAIPFTTSGKID